MVARAYHHKLQLWLWLIAAILGGVLLPQGEALGILTISVAESISVDEELPVGSELVPVLVSLDGELVNDGTFGFVSGNDEQYFNIDNSGVVTFATQLDYEDPPNYDPFKTDAANNRYIIVVNYTTPDLLQTIEKSITVHLQDINDNTPSFNQTQYEVSLPENSPVGYLVFQAFASDPDQVESQAIYDEEEEFLLGYEHTITNGLVSYSIINGNQENQFVIDSISGNITVAPGSTIDVDFTDFYNLTILAKDGGNLTNTSQLLITILDSNDNPPFILYPDNFTLNLTEDTVPGDLVILDYINATDDDYGLNSDIYFAILEGDVTNSFTIDNQTGMVNLTGYLDREAQNPLKLIIAAIDQGQPPLQDTLIVTIYISDVNDEAPMFTSSVYDFEVEEIAPTGTHVGDVLAEDNDEGGGGIVTYSLTEPSSECFSIDNSTGRITVGDCIIDRESQPFYTLIVTATDNPANKSLSLNSTAIVNITVLDINDESPQWNQSEYSVSILDTETPGFVVITLTATDADIGPNGMLTYELLGGDDPAAFVINSNTGAISLNRPVDFAIKQNYTYEVRAQDGGSPTKGKKVPLTIFVHTPNINPPVFLIKDQNLTLSENTSVGTVVVNISATDKDIGLIGRVWYRIADVSVFDGSGSFSVDSDTGAVFISEELDYDYKEDKSIFFQVEAYDGGFPEPYTDITNLTVYLTNVNDEVPKIIIPFQNTPTIPENLPPFVEFANLSKYTIDEDPGDQGLFSFELLQIYGDDYEDDSFNLTEDGVLMALRTFDREENPQGFILSIETMDFGDVPLSLITNVTVLIGDDNDQRPFFEPNTTSVLVYEYRLPGVVVLDNFTALDNDIGINAELNYTISDGDTTDSFTVDSNGTIYTTKPLNKTEQRFYTLTIMAIDKGAIPLYGYGTVFVEVIDINDNVPMFDEPLIASFYEDDPPGTVFYQLNATDSDEGVNSHILYYLSDESVSNFTRFDIDSNSSIVRFAVDEITGDVSMHDTFDTETESEFQLTIIAIDSGIVPGMLNTTVVLTVLVDDVNDNGPVFLNQSYEFSVTENESPNYPIGYVHAQDSDASVPNNQNSFYLDSVWSDDNITVDGSTGLVYVNGTLDWEVADYINVTVYVEDHGVPSLSSSVSLTLSIIDVNDRVPEWDDDSLSLSIQENLPLGSSAGPVLAIDPDSPGNNSIVYYDIIHGMIVDYFSINQTTGEITSLATFNREKIDRYNVTVVAYDSGSPQQSSVATLMITISDDNDHNPYFSSMFYNATISENIDVNTTIIDLKASDKDIGVNGLLTYTIPSSYYSQYFVVNPATGELSTGAVLNFEDISYFEFEVLVVDNGSPQRNDTAIVMITITDYNDEAPVFDQPHYNITLIENIPIGSNLLHIQATDVDSDVVTYSLQSTSVSSYFEIDQTVGMLYTVDFINREELGSNIKLTVIANNSAEAINPLSSTATVFIEILDLNDQRPTLDYTITVPLPEDTPFSSVVYTLEAMDGDEGLNGTLVYEIAVANDDGLFTVNSTSGEVYLNGNVDYEHQQYHYVGVNVTDMGLYPLTGYATIVFQVIDVNDNEPVFAASRYRVSIQSSYDTPGNEIISVFASDKDGDTIAYSILSGNEDSLFSVGQTTGLVTVQDDLESFSNTLVNLTIQATDGVYNDTAIVSIYIVDGDSPPLLFLSLSFLATATEGDPGIVVSSALVITVLPKEFQIVEGNDNNVFSIDMNTGTLSADVSKLDYELKSFYQLTVSLSEVSEDTASYSVINVTVTDKNEHSPVFRSSSFNAKVYETLETKEPFFTVLAEDQDGSSPHNEVTYSITAGSGLFSIDANSGELSLKNRLDYDIDQHNYALTIITENADSTPTLSNSTIVTVELLDGNRHAPVFTGIKPHIPVQHENTAIGTILTTVHATDRDNSNTSNITYTLLGNHRHYDVEIDGTTGEISIGPGGFDFERQTDYHLIVVASDDEVPTLTATATIDFNIIDENDNSPVWEQQQYSTSILESTAPGTTVISILATDKDYVSTIEYDPIINAYVFDNENGHVVYSISEGDPKSQFRIINDTYNPDVNDIPTSITVISSLDREDISEYNLTVTATDGGGRSTNTYIYIKIIDENDVTPSFNASSLFVDVSEHAEVGSLVTSVPAMDKDTLANSRLLYNITDGNVYHTFSIDNRTADIFLERELDRESLNSYTLSIEAVDSGVTQLTGSTVLYITVLDENEHKPVFAESAYSASVLESIDSDYVILQVTASDDDTEINSDIVFSIVSSSVEDQFKINSTSGEITINKEELDYEEVSEYRLVVQASDSAPVTERLNTSVNVTISVQDVNDNNPVFDQANYTAVVFEDDGPNTDILQVIAYDADSYSNGEVRYSLMFNDSDTGNNFMIEEEEGNITLTDSLSLDFEQRELYEFYAVATDQGAPPLTSSVLVSVVVMDVNDNAPVFEHELYNSTVMENLASEQELLTVSAIDIDSNENGEVVYSLGELATSIESCFYLCPSSVHSYCENMPELNSSIVQHQFAVDSVTGLLTTNASFDREYIDRYIFTIVATDSSVDYPQQSSESCAVIDILDANDETPKFINLPSTVSVMEEQPTGVLVYNVSAFDMDIGPNSIITYELADNGGNFSINSITGSVYTLNPLDRETVDGYNITVIARDSANNSAVSHLVVKVTDVNDSPPLFELPLFAFTVNEDIDLGAVVYTVTATDADIGDNAIIQYTVVSIQPVAHFSINSTTGDVYTSSVLDRELYSSYTVTVMAIDPGNLNSTTVLNITITDVNDNEPIFSQSVYMVSVTEEQLTQDPILTVQASDEDIGVNSYVSYSLTNTSDYIAINDTTGDVYLKQKIDYEAIQWLSVTVMATNSYATLQLFSTATLNVTINDINDHSPVFSTPQYQAIVSEASPIGHVVLQVNAIDADGTVQNNTVSYFIVNSTNVFGINQTTGEIYVSQVLDSDTPPTVYTIMIRGEDNGGRFDTSLVTITLSNTNDNPPIFVQEVYNFDSIENNMIGSFVGKVVAMDADNDNVSYFISEDEENYEYFRINSETGEIFSNVSFDREVEDIYQLNITTVDDIVNGNYVEVSVYMTVLDVNDNEPVFQNNSYVVSVYEDTDLDSIVTTVHAMDADLGNNSISLYSIQPSELSSYFYIHGSTGEVHLNHTLDREDISLIEITLKATDKLDETLFTMANLTVYVLDINDNPPVFSSHVYNATLLEETTVPMIISNDISASDEDIGENGRITFSIGSDYQHLFSINESSGVVTLISPLDYEEAHNYSVTLFATDNGQSISFEVVSELFVTVVDINDNSPYFEESSYNVTILENSPQGMSVLRLSAIDIDDGVNSELTYTILTGNVGLYFGLEKDTGLLKVNNYIDYEIDKSFKLEVQVVDQGIPQYTATTTVNVFIEDTNDNPPQFTAPIYYASVPEDADVGSAIASMISANDADSGINSVIRYYITSGDVDDAFHINESTGDLTVVNNTLDYEERSSYSLTITAEDGGSPSLTDSCQLIITVTNVNEYTPVIYSDNYHLNVSQYTAVGTTVAYTTAYDPDDKETLSTLSYNITLYNTNMFGVTPRGEVYVYSTLMAGQYSITVEISDGVNSDSVTIDISVYDHTYTDTTFDLPTYIFDIAEGAPVSTVVGNVLSNGVFNAMYFVSPEGELVQDTDQFSINTTTGTISLVGTLDWEDTPYHVLNMKGVTINNNEVYTIVTIRVVDENDNPPIFENDQYSIVVSEWATLGGDPLIMFQISDVDSPGVNTDAVISITEGTEYFRIGSPGNALIQIQELDRELTEFITVIVIANNSEANIIQYSSAEVLVTVKDENDNAPVFNEPYYDVQVIDSTPIEDEVLTVQATDADQGMNADLVYSIVYQSIPEAFTINRTSGTIYTGRSFAGLAETDMTLTVRVADQGVPTPKASSSLVFVSILKTNLHSPVFSQPDGYATDIDETVSVGVSVIQVSAQDGDNDTVTYATAIADGDIPFTVSPLTGIITVSGELDYSEQQFYSIAIIASDNGSPTRNTSTLVNISINDVNTHSPSFTAEQYTENVYENISVGSPVLQIHATDPDTVFIQYVITVNYPLDGVEWFTINGSTGVITTNAVIDRETTDQVTLVVSAIDSGYPIQRSTSVNVVININDTSDEYPVFDKPVYSNIDVIRLTPPQYPVTQVAAYDSDIITKDIEYQIEDQEIADLFAIDPVSGRIQTSMTVPENMTNTTLIVVSAFDGYQRSNATVNISIVTDGTFCVDDFCTAVKERQVDHCPFGVCSVQCELGYDLTPLDWLCRRYYCNDTITNVNLCVEEERCLPDDQLCGESCVVEGFAKCKTTEYCYDQTHSTPCANGSSCLMGQTLVQSSDGVLTCNQSDTLPPNGRDCIEPNAVYCSEMDTCSNLNAPNLCQYCLIGEFYCSDTHVCVNDSKYCCGSNNEYYCDKLDTCLSTDSLCEFPNIAPLINQQLIYYGTVEDEPMEATMIGVILATDNNGSVSIAKDTQGEEVGMAIVQVSSATSGEWQYGECTSTSDVDSCIQCNSVSSWNTISNVSDTYALHLPNTACLRYLRKGLQATGAGWMHVKLWDGNSNGYVSYNKTIVRHYQPFFSNTLPYTPNGPVSESSTLLTILLTPINSYPVLGTTDPQLTSIIENTDLQDNLGDSVIDIVKTISFQQLPILVPSIVEGLPEYDGHNNSINYTSLIPSTAIDAYYSAIDSVNPTRANRQSSNPSIAVQITTDASSNGDWQVSLNGDPQLYVYFKDIVGISTNRLVILNTTSLIRFVPKSNFNGVATLSAYPWDGVLPQSVDEVNINGFHVYTATQNSFSSHSINSVVKFVVNVNQVEQSPVIIKTLVSLSTIPYSMRFTYDTLYTITVLQPINDDMLDVVEAVLLLTLDYSVIIYNVIPAPNSRSFVTFSVVNNALNISEIQAAINSKQTLLNTVLPISEITQNALYGSNIACDGDDSTSKGEVNGDLIATLLSTLAVDYDGDQLGVAVISVGGLNKGVWQYSRGKWSEENTLKTSGTWFNFPSSLGEQSALLLHGNDRIRYIPRPSWYWTDSNAPSITVKAWDNTLGSILEYGNNEVSLMNINTNPYIDTPQSIHKPRGRFSTGTATIMASRYGCDNSVNSGAAYDACCVCGGSGDGCSGCDGSANSNKQFDSCGECDGGDISCVGCDGIPYSFNTPSSCSECVINLPTNIANNSSSLFRDCTNTCYGIAIEDDCGVCSEGTSDHKYNEDMDCFGVCFGDNILDDCQYCTGPDTGISFNQYLDCTGVCNGPFRADSCDVCQLPNEEGHVTEHEDCHGECHGSAQKDSCGVCYGKLTEVSEAGSVLDQCGVCFGNDTSCYGCDGVLNSGTTIDNCGVCGGNNCGCSVLTSVSPSKGSATGGTKLIITGAGFFLNTSTFDPALDNCNVTDEAVSVLCQFSYNQQQTKAGIAGSYKVDQGTIFCTTPSIDYKDNEYELRIRLNEDQDLFPSTLSYLFQSYDDVTITEMSPAMGLINDNTTVTFSGANFFDNGEQMKCLMKVVGSSDNCLEGLPTVSDNYHSVNANFVSDTVITCAMPVIDIPCKISLDLSFDGQQSGIISYSLSEFVYAFSSPKVTAIQFSVDLASLSIQFDRSVRIPNQSGQLVCSSAFSTETLDLLGNDASCSWGSTQQNSINVLLTIHSNVIVGSSIIFKEDAIVTDGVDFSFAISGVFRVEPTTPPVVILEGPSTVSASTDSVYFTAINSYYEGYSNFKYRWSVFTLDADIPGMKEIAEDTNNLPETESAISISIDRFQSNTLYIVQVNVTNAVGMSSVISKEIMKESSPSLQVSISSPEYQTITVDQDVLLHTNIVNSHCSSCVLEFDWKVYRLTDERRMAYELQELSGLITDTRVFYIPSGSLLPVNIYKISLTAAISSPAQTSSKDIYITVKDVQCQARVHGSNRTLPVSERLLLDGSVSITHTSVDRPIASYVWQCSVVNDGTPCYNASVKEYGRPISLPFKKVVSFSTSDLQPGKDYMFTLTVSQGAECESKSHTVISIVPASTSPPAIVHILTSSLSYFLSERTIIEGLVLPSKPVEIVWECLQLPDHSYIELNNDVLLSPWHYNPVTESELSSYRDYVIQGKPSTVNLVFKPGVLNGTQPYVFRLTAKSLIASNSNATTSVTLIPYVTPDIQSLLALPVTGTETLYEIRVNRVTADVNHYPLFYQYGVINGDYTQWLTGAVAERVITTHLPTSDPTTVIVRVYDNRGVYSEATVNVRVTSQNNGIGVSVEELMNSLNNNKDWVGTVSSFQSLLLSINGEITSSQEQSNALSLYSTLFNEYMPLNGANVLTVITMADLLTAKLLSNLSISQRSQILDTLMVVTDFMEELTSHNFNDIHSITQLSPSQLLSNRYNTSSFVEATTYQYTDRLFQTVSTLTNTWNGELAIKELQIREKFHHVLCQQAILGESSITLRLNNSRFTFVKGVPAGIFTDGNNSTRVELGSDGFIDVYNKIACAESAAGTIACSETCIQLTTMENDYFALSSSSFLSISSSSINLINRTRPFTDPEQVKQFSEIVSFDMSLPTQSNGYTSVTQGVNVTVHFSQINPDIVNNGSTLLCMHRASSATDGSFDSEWRIETNPANSTTILLADSVNDGGYSCTYSHLSQFVIGVLPPPYEPIVSSSLLPVSSSSFATVIMTTSFVVISSPILLPTTSPIPVTEIVSGVVVAIALITVIVVVVIIVFVVKIRKSARNEVHPVETQESPSSSPSPPPSSRPSTDEVMPIHLRIIKLLPSGEREEVTNLDVPQPSRLRELRNLIYEAFPQPFYLCTTTLGDIATASEQQQFVRIVYRDIVYIREVDTTNHRARQQFCVCGRVAIFQCSTCNERGYCSTDCQNRDWSNNHQRECSRVVERQNRANVLQTFASRRSVGSNDLPTLPSPDAPVSTPELVTDQTDDSVRQALDTNNQTLVPNSPQVPSNRPPLRTSVGQPATVARRVTSLSVQTPISRPVPNVSSSALQTQQQRTSISVSPPSLPTSRPSVDVSPPSLPTARPSVGVSPLPFPTGRPSIGGVSPPSLPTNRASVSIPTLPRRESLQQQIPSPHQASNGQLMFVMPQNTAVPSPGQLQQRMSLQSIRSPVDNQVPNLQRRTEIRQEPSLAESSSTSDDDDEQETQSHDTNPGSRPPSLSTRRRGSSRMQLLDQEDDQDVSSDSSSGSSSSDSEGN